MTGALNLNGWSCSTKLSALLTIKVLYAILLARLLAKVSDSYVCSADNPSQDPSPSSASIAVWVAVFWVDDQPAARRASWFFDFLQTSLPWKSFSSLRNDAIDTKRTDLNLFSHIARKRWQILVLKKSFWPIRAV